MKSRKNIIAIFALLALVFAGCSNLLEDIKSDSQASSGFTAIEKTVSAADLLGDTGITAITSAVSADESIVTVTKNADGSVTFTSVKEGTTTITVRGTDANGKTKTLTYTVTVDKNGAVTIGDTPTVFNNETETVTPKVESVSLQSTESAEASPEGVITVTVNEGGTITLVGESAGTTTLTVNGTNASGDTVTVTYTVTVAADGTITVKESKAFDPTSGTALTSVTSAKSEDETVATITVNDGKVTLTAQAAGTTTITVKGKDSNDNAVTLTYIVTVGDDGSIKVEEPTVFTNESKEVTTPESISGFEAKGATSADENTVSVTVDSNGKVTIVGESAGTTTITVTGTNAKVDTIIVTYSVDVDKNGNITLGTPEVKNGYTVTFKDGESTFATQTVESGEKARKRASPQPTRPKRATPSRAGTHRPTTEAPFLTPRSTSARKSPLTKRSMRSGNSRPTV